MRRVDRCMHNATTADDTKREGSLSLDALLLSKKDIAPDSFVHVYDAGETEVRGSRLSVCRRHQ